MKAFGIFAAAIFLFGTSVLVLAKQVQFQPWVKTGQEARYEALMEANRILNAPRESSAVAKFSCDATEFDFGTMRVGEETSHTFVIGNAGDADLAISDAGTSCSCLSNDFGSLVIAPGETKEIVLTWSPYKLDKQFYKYQKIRTNDPEREEVILAVKGKAMTSLAANVAQIGMRMSPDSKGMSESFEIYSEVWPEIEVKHVEVLPAIGVCEVSDSVQKAGNFIAGEPQVSKTILFTADAPDEMVRGAVRVSVKPPQEVIDSRLNAQGKISDGLTWLDDETVLLEVPFELKPIRQMSLYASFIETRRGIDVPSQYDVKLELGNLFKSDTEGHSWVVIGKLRGNRRPTELTASISGIENLKVRLDVKRTESGEIGNSFRLELFADGPLPAGIYNRQQAAILRIEAPGLPGEELLEIPVNLKVIADSERR